MAGLECCPRLDLIGLRLNTVIDYQVDLIALAVSLEAQVGLASLIPCPLDELVNDQVLEQCSSREVKVKLLR